MIQHKETIDSKYIQQHLANERTFLAWIRTAIAMVGIGFVIVNLHFSLEEKISHIADVVAIVFGFLAFILGISTILLSTISYTRKRDQINHQTFRAEKNLIYFLSISLIASLVVMGILFVIYLFNNVNL